MYQTPTGGLIPPKPTAAAAPRHGDRRLARTRAKLERLRNRYVKTPRDAEFRDHLDRLLRSDPDGQLRAVPVTFNAAGDTHGIAISDGPGGGKTTLVKRGLATHPALQPTDARPMPVLYVRVPSPATLKSLGIAILRATGYGSVSERRERWSIWSLVFQRLRMLGIVVLWIDEAHDLFESASRREMADMLKTLKSLMQGEGAVIVILSGVETLWQAVMSDAQVQRRFSRIVLPTVTAAAQGREIRGLVRSYCAEAGLSPPQAEDDLVARLIHAARGRFGRCIEALIAAIEQALLEEATRLEIDHFARAYAMKEGCAPERNVFLAVHWARIDPDARPKC
jgi:hypothetical protein